MASVARLITEITFVFTLPIRCISVVKCFLFFQIFLAFFFITLLFPEIAVIIIRHVPFSLSRTIESSLLLEMVVSVFTCRFLNMVNLLSILIPAKTRK